MGGKKKEEEDQSSAELAFEGDPSNSRAWDDDLDPPPDIDWDEPPVYELVGSGNRASTTVVAQGESRPI
ncbi:hypothetical protein EIK77_006758 [Talaromyces pinophilus]|nr:hypothetical protein EIK77_006758 [Talaromyces pinophilus]